MWQLKQEKKRRLGPVALGAQDAQPVLHLYLHAAQMVPALQAIIHLSEGLADPGQVFLRQPHTQQTGIGELCRPLIVIDDDL